MNTYNKTLFVYVAWPSVDVNMVLSECPWHINHWDDGNTTALS